MCLFCKHAFEILRILRSNYFCCVAVWVPVSLTIICGLFPLAVWTLSYYGLMITFGVACPLFVMLLFFDQAWLQATLHCSLGGLGLCEAFRASLVAFLGCCVSSSALCSQLLSTFSGGSVTLSSIPGEELAIARLSALLSGASVPEVSASQLSEAQLIFQFHLDTCQSNSLLSSCSLCDQARIRAISSHACASARAILWALPCSGRSLCVHFCTGLHGIPLFASTDSIRCSCGSVVSQFGDHCFM